jgi:phosphatidylserine/phosphatidylglycerophosphate/cardiolipin synthase-like enzyme
MKKSFLTVVFFILVSHSAISAELRVCFTPNQDCTTAIAELIDSSRSELLVQAYGFTSTAILEAVARAKHRGVKVAVILDKINEQRRYTAATFLKNHDIEPLIDDQVAIAHNKVIVVDRRNTVTGSFNFTIAAQKRNAENVLFILDDEAIADAYAKNWQSRAGHSRPYSDFRKTGRVRQDPLAND